MNPILHNLVEMTSHRDPLQLEGSMLSTLLTFKHIAQVRTLEFFIQSRVAMVRPRCWSEGGQVVSSPHPASVDPQALQLAQLPRLARCIENHQTRAQEVANGHYTLWLPIWVSDKAHSCLEITQIQPPTTHQRGLLMGVFLVYQNYQRLLDYSERDPLTGLYNRRTFEEQFARQVDVQENVAGNDRMPRHWLAMLDIDHFKVINDRFGHLYGDEVLILVAKRLRMALRAEDHIFRYGGEEFVVLLRSITLAQARGVVERLRAAIEGYAFPQVGTVTVSIGFAATQAGTPVENLGRADQALYYAKDHGRNQVCFYDDLVSSGASKTKITHGDVDLF
jgi:diguanylate cyclase (GGDEF)-like protein